MQGFISDKAPEQHECIDFLRFDKNIFSNFFKKYDEAQIAYSFFFCSLYQPKRNYSISRFLFLVQAAESYHKWLTNQKKRCCLSKRIKCLEDKVRDFYKDLDFKSKNPDSKINEIFSVNFADSVRLLRNDVSHGNIDYNEDPKKIYELSDGLHFLLTSLFFIGLCKEVHENTVNLIFERIINRHGKETYWLKW